jgi:hypothetical protein
MDSFREFVQNQNISMDLVYNAFGLEPGDKSSLSIPISGVPISNPKRKLLSQPEVRDILTKSRNRGAVLRALDNKNTTVGNIVSMLNGI